MNATRWFLLATCLFIMAPPAWGQSPSVRQRLSMNSDWRFEKGDPPGSERLLNYARVRGWVIATGNEFVTDSSARRVRLQGNLGDGVSYTERTFNDNGWRQLDLPHDWGIEGPFKQEYPGETGKLPWWGVGWYRKHLTVPANERGRQFYLDIDGAMAYATVWLNGHFVGGWPYGYASFELDLTPYMSIMAIQLISNRFKQRKEMRSMAYVW